jgi:hypothetical protein
MSEINICNSSNRDAVVLTSSTTSTRRVRWLDQDSRQVQSARFIKGPIDRRVEALRARHGDLAKVAAAIIEDDPEIDFEQIGRFLTGASRVYLDCNQQVIHKVKFWEVVRRPDGSVRERRPRQLLEPNLAEETPLRWSGKYIKKDDACRRFVFSGKLQLRHVNGLTYDLLFGIAKELEDRQCLLLVGGGPKGNQPLILRRGGSPYRGFLEGRTQGTNYALILHLSNLELKAPTETEPAESTAGEAVT